MPLRPSVIYLLGFFLVTTLVSFGCRTGNGSDVRELSLDNGHVGNADRLFVTLLDRNCAGGCHNSTGDQDRLPYASLVMFATKTKPLHECLQEKRCLAPNLRKAAASACWQCVTSNKQGVYLASVEEGLLRRIATTAQVSDADFSKIHAMPPAGARQTRFGTSDRGIDEIAAWLTAEAGSNFAKIRAIRPPPEATVDARPVVCDDIPPLVTKTINEDFYVDNLPMFGCPSATAFPDHPAACLGAFPAKTEWADKVTPGLVVREMRRLVNRGPSTYWTRSSADGRFVVPGNGYLEDLQVAERKINVDGAGYDPVFSPDNKFYGFPDKLCAQWPLYDTSSGAAVKGIGVRLPNSHCLAASVDTYRSLGRNADGDILTIRGYVNSNDGYPAASGASDANAVPASDDTFEIGRIRSTGNTLTILDRPLKILSRGETDFQMAPSGDLIVGSFQVGGKAGYRVRALKPDGTTIDPTRPDGIGTICMRGEKANISFDNRFVAFHHYSDGSPQDRGETKKGVANIFVYDLKSKRAIRATDMGASGDQAFYPHFRADGWIYFLVKGKDGIETVAASNAALVLAAGDVPAAALLPTDTPSAPAP